MSPSPDGRTYALGLGSQGLVPSLPAWPGPLRTRRCPPFPAASASGPASAPTSLRSPPVVGLSPGVGA